MYWEHLLSLQYHSTEIKGHLEVQKPTGKELSASEVKLITSAKFEGSALVIHAGEEKSFNLNVTQDQGW